MHTHLDHPKHLPATSRCSVNQNNHSVSSAAGQKVIVSVELGMWTTSG